MGEGIDTPFTMDHTGGSPRKVYLLRAVDIELVLVGFFKSGSKGKSNAQ